MPPALRARIAAHVLDYQGDATVEEVAAAVGEPVDTVRAEVKAMVAAGDMERGRFRLHSGLSARVQSDEDEARRLCRHVSARRDGEELAYRMVVALADAPLSAPQLARTLDPWPSGSSARRLPGGARRIAAALSEAGVVSLPTHLWITERGRALLAEERA